VGRASWPAFGALLGAAIFRAHRSQRHGDFIYNARDMRAATTFLLTALLLPTLQAAQTLDTYVIDVEGGKAVLVVSPSGDSLLFDAGWPGYGGRDNNRIIEAAKAAGLKQIDYLVISHYDIDHVGDVPGLIAAFPVKHIVDNGSLQSSGDKIPIKGVDVLVVTAGTKAIQAPLPGAGAPNPFCATTPAKPEITGDLEDNTAIGLLFTLGKFRMLDLSDLEAAYDYKLMCPNNPIGAVDVYQVSVHGQEKGMSGVLAPAIHPRVAIMGNGPRKGGDPATWPVLRSVPGLEDIWQSHFSVLGGKENNPPDDYIANLDQACQGKCLKISAQADGSFTVTNSRNGFEKTYKARN
jgi:beta-lactamase superfamily II metal-dependent hydrolase